MLWVSVVCLLSRVWCLPFNFILIHGKELGVCILHSLCFSVTVNHLLTTHVTLYLSGHHLGYSWDFIHLLPSLEGDMKICSAQKIHVARGRTRGRHEFSGLNKSSCLPTNWVSNFLLYRKLKEHLLSRKHALNRSSAYFRLSF